jgi:hypothetical protein
MIERGSGRGLESGLKTERSIEKLASCLVFAFPGIFVWGNDELGFYLMFFGLSETRSVSQTQSESPVPFEAAKPHKTGSLWGWNRGPLKPR